jgi:hypothetical protein
VNKALINLLDEHNIHEERNADWNAARKEIVFQSPGNATMLGDRGKGNGKEQSGPVQFVARTYMDFSKFMVH